MPSRITCSLSLCLHSPSHPGQTPVQIGDQPLGVDPNVFLAGADVGKELRVALAAAKLKEELSLKKEHIRFFLHQFTDMDYTDIDCQKRLIKIFLNSVFVYDDKVVLTFNYSEDGKILTLHEIDGGSGHSIRIPSGLVHHAKKSVLKRTLFFHYVLCGRPVGAGQ